MKNHFYKNKDILFFSFYLFIPYRCLIDKGNSNVTVFIEEASLKIVDIYGPFLEYNAKFS